MYFALLQPVRICSWYFTIRSILSNFEVFGEESFWCLPGDIRHVSLPRKTLLCPFEFVKFTVISLVDNLYYWIEINLRLAVSFIDAQSRWELEYEEVMAILEADRDLDRYSYDSDCWHNLFWLENFGCTNKTFISVLLGWWPQTLFYIYTIWICPKSEALHWKKSCISTSDSKSRFFQ